MINLYKVELSKILHKKGFWIICVLLFLFTLLDIAFFYVDEYLIKSVEDFNTSLLESNLKDYDLSNEQEKEYYISDKSELEFIKISKKYDNKSPEYYYAANTIREDYANYLRADLNKYPKEEIETAKKKYEDDIYFLEHFNWQKVINDILAESKDNLSKKDELELSENEIREEEEKIRVMEYRLNNNIPLSYEEQSQELDSYLGYVNTYYNFNDDNKLTKEELHEKEESKAIYLTNKYYIDNNLELKNDYSDTASRTIISEFTSYNIFFIIAIIYLTGGIVSEEFNKGTIKQLLLKPYTRSKILGSKLFTCLTLFIAFVLYYILLDIIKLVITGYDLKELLDPFITYSYSSGKVIEVNLFIHIIYTFVSILPYYLILMVSVLFVGVVTTHTSIANTFGYLIALFSDLITVFNIPQKISSFLLPYTWDLSGFMYGAQSVNKYITFSKSLIVDITFIAIVLIITFIIFNRKDVKNQ